MVETLRKPTREEVAQAEVGQTDIHPLTARLTIAVFLLVIVLIPLFDAVMQWRSGGVEGIRALDVIRRPPDLFAHTFPVYHQEVVRHNPLHEYESDVENASFIRTVCQQHLQAEMSSIFHVGNSKVVLGTDDWLFYRDGLDYLLGTGFLGQAHQHVRWRLHPDPRPAILHFFHECQNAGVRLVLLPVADKAQIQPEKLSGSFREGEEIENPDFERLIKELRSAGVEILPTADVLRTRARSGPAFLRQDTHWTPEAMDAVATMVASHCALPDSPAHRTWIGSVHPIANLGDLVAMLKLPANQKLYHPQSVRTVSINDAATGNPWTPSQQADVLLLGDSFANVYSDPTLKWGTAAGLAPHLSFHLGRDLDVIAMNGQGATGTRKVLAERTHPLAGKKIVIWEFSVRDLAVADWQITPLTERLAPSISGEVEMDVTLTALSAIKAPGSVPYTEALTTIKGMVLQVQRGSYVRKEILLVTTCMKYNVLLPVARLRQGDTIHVTVRPWETVAATEGAKNTYDDTEEVDLDRWWIADWSRK